jgi:DNA-binding response OmpR family regulator
MSIKHIIVYAEDDPDDLDLVRHAFARQGTDIELYHEPNGLAALETVKQLVGQGLKPCLIILDINMPKMDGKQTLMELKQDDRLKDLSVMMFTTSSSQLDILFARKWGADFLTKPLKVTEVEDLANRFVLTCKH